MKNAPKHATDFDLKREGRLDRRAQYVLAAATFLGPIVAFILSKVWS